MTRTTGLKPEGYDWDAGNKEKSWIKHKVTFWECEQAFFNTPLKVFEDFGHAIKEKRFLAYGETNSGRRLTVVFTMRRNKVRVISGRDQNKKEEKIYEQN